MRSIIVYGYDRFTKTYTGPIEAYESPLEPGKYLDPAFSLRKRPPEYGRKTIPIVKGDSWELSPDHRGETWFDKYGNEVTIDVLGDPSISGLMQVRPEIELVKPTRLSLFKTEIYERMKDDELDMLDTVMENAGTRFRLMWRDCLPIEVESPFFKFLKEQMIATFGKERADTILSLEI